jgi:hypothetical protein
VAQARQRRRRRALITAGVVVAAGLAIAAFVLTRPPTPSCADEGAATAQHWNPAAADALRHKLTASGAPYAEQINTSVAAKYTRYAQAWTTMRVAACTARHAGDTSAERTIASRGPTNDVCDPPRRLAVEGLDRDALDVNLHWFMTSHVELVLQNRIEGIGIGASTGGATSGWSLLHAHYRL